MDADADDPEPNPFIHRAPFYGLWPRWADEADRADVEDAAFVESGADV